MTWLHAVFGRGDARRILVALACSIALHELLAGLIPALPAEDKKPEVVAHVTVARIEHTPAPTPTPTPPPIHTLAFTPAGKASRRETVVHNGAARPKPPHALTATPDAYVAPVSGQGAGEGTGSDAGSLGRGSGGSGTGDAGNGGGAAPCGYVELGSRGEATFNPETGKYERNNVYAIVHFSDGSTERLPFDWTWTYASEDEDPFKNLQAPMYFQFPPEAQRANEPALVQFIMRYTNVNGSTRLNDCPTPSPG
jgi:hypothetical protein